MSLIELIKRKSFFDKRLFVGAALSALSLFVAAIWLLTANPVEKKTLSRADAIYVFSGGAEYLPRSRKAAEMFGAKRAAIIVLTNDTGKSGWSPSEQRNLFYWELARRELIARGVPADAIEVLPEPVASTHDEAVLLARRAAEQRWQAVLLVTSEFHEPRALLATERAFQQQNVGAEIGAEAAETSGKTANRWTTNAAETVKFWCYRLFY